VGFDPKDESALGHLKIRTSHLWIKHASSSIHCNGLGYPANQGPGTGQCGGGGGYRTKGEAGTGSSSKGGETYGEETLLKQIHCGSGGSCHIGGRGGGVIELIIEEHMDNQGTLSCNGMKGSDSVFGGEGGGSGGSILMKFESRKLTSPHILGIIRCQGGKGGKGLNTTGTGGAGGRGRIAVYGIDIRTTNLKGFDPKPYHRVNVQ